MAEHERPDDGGQDAAKLALRWLPDPLGTLELTVSCPHAATSRTRDPSPGDVPGDVEAWAGLMVKVAADRHAVYEQSDREVAVAVERATDPDRVARAVMDERRN